MHTSAKARLTRLRIHDPDRHQNLTSFVHGPVTNLSWKFHANPFASFCAKFLRNRQTDRQKQRRLHDLLGGGNKYHRTENSHRFHHIFITRGLSSQMILRPRGHFNNVRVAYDLTQRSFYAVSDSLPAFDVRSSGLLCGWPDGLELAI